MIYLISGNPEKEIEVKAILGKKNVDRLDIDLPEIQEIDPHKIIQAKLESAKKHHDGEFIVEDTSLYLEAFDYKLPGPLIKWFLNTIGIEGLAEIVEKSGKLGAKAVNLVGYYDPRGEIHFFEGSIEGSINSPRPKEGFGWDPIFIPEGFDKTFEEMGKEEKNKISHRRQALENLKKYLEEK